MTTRTIKKHFKWCLEQAKENLGAHTGGPYENEFRVRLRQAEKAYKSINQCNCKQPMKDI